MKALWLVSPPSSCQRDLACFEQLCSATHKNLTLGWFSVVTAGFISFVSSSKRRVIAQPRHWEASGLAVGPRVKAVEQCSGKAPGLQFRASEPPPPQRRTAGPRLQCHLVAACIFQHSKKEKMTLVKGRPFEKTRAWGRESSCLTSGC